MWYQPDGTRVVTEGHNLVSQPSHAVSGLGKGGKDDGRVGALEEVGGSPASKLNSRVLWSSL